MKLLTYKRFRNFMSLTSYFLTVPSIPPKSIDTTPNSPFSIIVAWSNLLQREWNGKPIGYEVRYSDSNGNVGNETVFFPVSSCTLQGLIPLTTYVIEVCAYTKEGAGPCQKVGATTLPSGKFIVECI